MSMIKSNLNRALRLIIKVSDANLSLLAGASMKGYGIIKNLCVCKYPESSISDARAIFISGGGSGNGGANSRTRSGGGVTLNNSLLKIILSLTLVLPTLGAAADSFPPSHEPAPIYVAIDKIKTRVDAQGGFGRTFMTAGSIFLDTGFIGSLVGFVICEVSGTKYVPITKMGIFLLKRSGPMLTVGIVGTAVGYVVAQIEKTSPKNNASPTPADPYKSPEGMEQFLKLSPEEQAKIAAEDEGFTKFIQDSAQGLESLEPKD